MIDGDPIECSRCGEPHRRCTAHNRAGKACGNIRMIGQTVCRMHGGKAKQNREAGLRKREIEKAIASRKELIAHKADGQGVTDPLAIMAELATEALALKDSLAQRVNALNRLRFTDQKGSEQLRSEVVLYERALDRSAKFVELLARSGFEEARVRLEQQKGQLVAYVISRILDQLNLTQDQKLLVGTVVPQELRKLTGEEPS